MLQTRTNIRQVAAKTTQAKAERSLMMRDKNHAEAVLRDMAYILHLTQTVRKSMSVS